MGINRHVSLTEILLSSVLFLRALALPASNAGQAGPTITIASGVVVDTTSQPTRSTAFANAYLGVPFAKSPPERFSPPEAAPSWSSPLMAQAFRPACIQQFSDSGNAQVLQKQYFGNPAGPLPAESEDCLYLNVFTPPNIMPPSKKAVMFWLFPGNLQFGTASLPIYDGSSLAVTQDVVVVTINYRTNIFGESAGGESVKQLLANPPSPLPFAAAIMQSQQSLLTGSGADSYQKVLKVVDVKKGKEGASYGVGTE